MQTQKIILEIDEKNEYISNMFSVVNKETIDVESYLQQLIDESTQHSYYAGLFRALCTLAKHYVIKNMKDSSTQQLHSAEKLITEGLLNKSFYALLYNTYIFYYVYLEEDIIKATECYEKGITNAEAYHDQTMIMKLKTNFAGICNMYEQFETSLILLRELEEYYKIDKDNTSLMYVYANMGFALEGLQEDDEAIDYIMKAFDFGFQREDVDMVKACVPSLVDLYLRKNDYEIATKILQDSLLLMNKSQNSRGFIELCVKLNEIYYDQGDYDMVYRTLLPLEGQVEDLSDELIQSNYFYLLSKAAQAINNYEKAYNSFTKYHQLEEALAKRQDKKHHQKVIDADHQKTIKQLKTIARIGSHITGLSSFDAVVAEIHSQLKSIMNIDAIGIGEVQGSQLIYNTMYINGVRLDQITRPIYPVSNLGTWVCANREELIINDVDAEHHEYSPKRESIQVDPDHQNYSRSIMYSPLLSNDELIGVFTIQSYQKQAYTPAEYEIFRIISSYVTVAMENIIQAKALEEMARTDALTGLYNRLGFTDMYTQLSSTSTNCSLMMFDVDNFKKTNDKYGHLVGDEVLQNIGQIMLTMKGPIFHPTRLGGEEFALFVTNCNDEETFALGETLRASIENLALKTSTTLVPTTVSIGIAYKKPSSDSITKLKNDFNELYSAADQMLYKAKSEGKNRVCIISVD